ncbi:uncharacterized protein LOC119569642, partial [Penaeus monodon]|uniref:uncharacterized protein LOC119569642 n=1 Tax=Penaeus monodon TaxID=6687 RepID=UPI0018A7741E
MTMPLNRSGGMVPDCQMAVKTACKPRGIGSPPAFRSSQEISHMPAFMLHRLVPSVSVPLPDLVKKGNTMGTLSVYYFLRRNTGTAVTIIKGDVQGVAQSASDCPLGSVHVLPGVQPNNVVLFEYHTPAAFPHFSLEMSVLTSVRLGGSSLYCDLECLPGTATQNTQSQISRNLTEMICPSTNRLQSSARLARQGEGHLPKMAFNLLCKIPELFLVPSQQCASPTHQRAVQDLIAIQY